MKYQLEFCIGSRLRRLSRIADSNIRKFLKDFNITENQMTIMFALHELGRVEQGKVGEVLFLERSTVSRNVKLLEKQGLINRSSDYRPEIELSLKGQELVAELIPHWEKATDILAGLLEKEGLEALSEMEKRLV